MQYTDYEIMYMSRGHAQQIEQSMGRPRGRTRGFFNQLLIYLGL